MMATFTPNNNFKKPAGSDYVLVGDLNGNMDIADDKIGNLAYLETTTKSNLVSAINEASRMGASPPPYFNEETLTWWQWSLELLQYADTGRPASAIVDVESTETLAPGTNADVENVGTNLDVKLRFKIPRGDVGEAATVTAGDTTTLAPGANANVTQRGTAQNRIFDFAIPRGETGAGLRILDHFNTFALLQAAHPFGNPGDMYTVGTIRPYDVYSWSESGNNWINQGPMGGGGGTVQSVNKINPDENGNITLLASDIQFSGNYEEPISTKTAILAITDSIGQSNGIAPLNASGVVPAIHVPSGLAPLNLSINPLIPGGTINQRAATTYNTVGQYTVDRKKLVSGTVTVSGSGTTATMTLNGVVREIIENPAVHAGQQITVSIEDGEISIGINADQTPFAPSVTVTLPATLTNLHVDIRATGGIPKRLQFIYGNQRLPFIPRHTGEELALCKRYYQIVRGYFYSTYLTASANEGITIQFPIEMRINPTVSIGAVLAGANITIHNLSINSVKYNSASAFAISNIISDSEL